jgi:hypothetical protein
MDSSSRYQIALIVKRAAVVLTSEITHEHINTSTQSSTQSSTRRQHVVNTSSTPPTEHTNTPTQSTHHTHKFYATSIIGKDKLWKISQTLSRRKTSRCLDHSGQTGHMEHWKAVAHGGDVLVILKDVNKTQRVCGSPTLISHPRSQTLQTLLSYM